MTVKPCRPTVLPSRLPDGSVSNVTVHFLAEHFDDRCSEMFKRVDFEEVLSQQRHSILPEYLTFHCTEWLSEKIAIYFRPLSTRM